MIVLFNQKALKPNKNRNRFSKYIVILSILTLLVYAGLVLYFYWHGRMVPSELTYSMFAFFGTEMVALAYINGKEKDAEKEVYKHEHHNEFHSNIL